MITVPEFQDSKALSVPSLLSVANQKRRMFFDMPRDNLKHAHVEKVLLVSNLVIILQS